MRQLWRMAKVDDVDAVADVVGTAVDVKTRL